MEGSSETKAPLGFGASSGWVGPGCFKPKEAILLTPRSCYSFVELCGAVMRSHDSSRQWTFELVEEYGECEE